MSRPDAARGPHTVGKPWLHGREVGGGRARRRRMTCAAIRTQAEACRTRPFLDLECACRDAVPSARQCLAATPFAGPPRAGAQARPEPQALGSCDACVAAAKRGFAAEAAEMDDRGAFGQEAMLRLSQAFATWGQELGTGVRGAPGVE